jgi:DNA-binding CsgD family transcriptional regulator/tetratricopeptide (TPR) repeat protein
LRQWHELLGHWRKNAVSDGWVAEFNEQVLLEREDALAELIALAEQAAGGVGGLVFLGGEAGVGKSALASALIEDAGESLAVRCGGCDNVTTAAALGPLMDAAPELTAVIEDEPAAVDRLRLFRRLRSVLSSEPTLLVLEDVHWADGATLEMLHFLGRRLDGLPLLVLATYRAEELTATHPLTVLLGELATGCAVRRMQLKPLSLDGVRRLVEAAGCRLDPEELHLRTSGNPFYVTEVVASCDEWLPDTVRDAVLARASRLSAAGREVLAAAAVLGQRADLQLLAAVSGQPPAAVDECVQGGMLIGDGQSWAFRHEIARLAIEQTLTSAMLTRLHAGALRALRPTADDRRLAHHAAASGDRDAVLRHAPAAAARASRLGAHREAAEQYRLALRFCPADADGLSSRAGLLAALSYECYLTDQLVEAYEARRAAMELFERTGELAAVGTAQRWLSRLSWFLGRNAESRKYAASAVSTLEPLGPSTDLAMAYSNQAQLKMLDGDPDGALSWGSRALELARRLGDRETEIHALNNIGTAQGTYGDTATGRQRLARSLALALAAGSHEHAARAYTNLGGLLQRSWQLPEADRQLRIGIGYSTEHGLDSWALYLSMVLAASLAEQGRYAEAQNYVDRVLRKPQLSPITRIRATLVAGQLAARRGADPSAYLDEALVLATATGETQRMVPTAVARAESAWIAGDPDRIVAEIDRAWPLSVAHPHPWDLGELSWWLAVAGVRRPTPVPIARPFALMVAGNWQAAAAEWQALGCPLRQALALAATPELAAARQGLMLAESLGAAGVRRAMLADRHARGLPLPRGPRPASRANPSGLTAREIDVLRLLVDGLSNADVARRLFLSEKTVGHHVSSVLHKLGEPTRSRAVATALRRGIVQPQSRQAGPA